MSEEHPLQGADLGNDARIVRQFPDDELPELTEEQWTAVRQQLADLTAGLCPVCKQVIDVKCQVGRCVYAAPCGHRLYQGKLGGNK